MAPRRKNPVPVVLALIVVGGMTLPGKMRLHGNGSTSEGGSTTLLLLIGLSAIAAFGSALHDISKP